MKAVLLAELKVSLTRVIEDRFRELEARLFASVAKNVDKASTCYDLPASISSELCLMQKKEATLIKDGPDVYIEPIDEKKVSRVLSFTDHDIEPLKSSLTKANKVYVLNSMLGVGKRMSQTLALSRKSSLD